MTERDEELARERATRRRKEIWREAHGFFEGREDQGWAAKAPNWPHAVIGSPEFAKFAAELRRFAQQFDGRQSALVCGTSGSGKTSSVLALLRRLAVAAVDVELALPEDRWPRRRAPELELICQARWTTGHALARARRQHGLGDGDAPLVRDSIDASLLIVDEVGFEPPGETLFEVIDARYTERRPTLITTGLTVAAFQQRYGDALFRRLTDDGIGVLVEASTSAAK